MNHAIRAIFLPTDNLDANTHVAFQSHSVTVTEEQGIVQSCLLISSSAPVVENTVIAIISEDDTAVSASQDTGDTNKFCFTLLTIILLLN